MAVNDNILASKIKKGDRHAFKEIYDRYHAQLYFIARRYLENDSLAKDAVQDIFLKFWSKREELDESLSIKGFLFTMMKNHVLDMLRKRDTRKKTRERFKMLTEYNSHRCTTEEKVVYTEYEDLTRQALNQLSPAVREVFEMRNFKGFSNSEIAKKNDVSVNTVKTQFYLGSKYIRDYLKKHAGF